MQLRYSGNTAYRTSTGRCCAVSNPPPPPSPFSCLVTESRTYVPGLTTPLSVSQFTLLASTKKGSKPDFHGALGGEEARRLYEYFFKKVREGYVGERVKDGVFQAMMEVALVNDGPVSPPFLPSSFVRTDHGISGMHGFGRGRGRVGKMKLTGVGVGYDRDQC